MPDKGKGAIFGRFAGDGTLYVEDGVPYMIFCHEWSQVTDGEICIVRLSDDLKRTVGEPKILFKASQPIWASSKINGGFITDGPFLYSKRKRNYASIFCILNFAKISRQSNIGQMMIFKAYPPTFDKENLRLHRRA